MEGLKRNDYPEYAWAAYDAWKKKTGKRMMLGPLRRFLESQVSVHQIAEEVTRGKALHKKEK